MSTKPEYLSTLTPKQHQALTLLAEGQSIASVARTCDVHRTTIYYWKRSNHEFAEALQDATWDFADHWRAESHKRAEAALALIDTFLADPKIPASVRLKAALHILTSATAPPPKFEQPLQDDPYRGANQLLAQMRADEAAKIEFFRAGYEARRDAEAAHESETRQDSTLFNTSNSNTNQQNPAVARPVAPKQADSSLFNTSTPDDDYKVATIRHAQPPTGRNKPCPCKSGKKYKHCCLHKPKAA